MKWLKSVLGRNRKLNPDLLDAAKAGDAQRVRKLLVIGADKEAKDKYGQTPLHHAAWEGHTSVVQVLVQAGADKGARDEDGRTPLHFAAISGHASVVQVLVQAGADKDAKDHDDKTPLHYAAGQDHASVVQVLVQAGADKEAKQKDGDTPLILAASLGRASVVQVLVQAGADKEARDKDGQTPLHSAAISGSASVVQALVQAGADKETKDKYGETPLLAAMGAMKVYPSVVEALVRAGADKEARDKAGLMILRFAADKDHASVVEILRNAGALDHSQPIKPATGGASQAQAQNLLRWERSGYPRKWVDDHHGQWTNADWLDLLWRLKLTDFWPMEPDAIRTVLEEQNKAQPSAAEPMNPPSNASAASSPTASKAPASAAKKPFTWSEGQPNPTSKSVTRVRAGTSSAVRFLCPTCSTTNTVVDADINDLTGALVICDGCENVSHVPAAYKTQPDASGLAVHGGVRVPIAEFNDWMLAHPSFRTPDGKLRLDVQFHGNYGLWGYCAGCQYQYASTVIATPGWSGELYASASVSLNAHSEKSRQDFEALSKKQCPRCASPDLIAIMVDVPQNVRDAINAEKKKRGV